LRRFVRATWGVTPRECPRDLREQVVLAGLAGGDSVKEITPRAGYTRAENFSGAFKRDHRISNQEIIVGKERN
jgi:methylphosphotriester-DNA--protein-cysteine methyltransferase